LTLTACDKVTSTGVADLNKALPKLKVTGP
jgi:hypothetical protein